MSGRVTYIFPSLNEEKNIVRCLNSIARQTYPHELIEVIVADAHSSDCTRRVVEDWGASHDISIKIVDNDRTITEFGTAVALKEATGDYIGVQGCDTELVEPDTIEAYVKAFDAFPDIVGVDRLLYRIPDGGALSNYIAVAGWGDPLAREIVREPTLLETRELDGRVYHKFEFHPGFPKLLFFRRNKVERYIGYDSFEEGQVLLDLAERGENQMARVDGYGYRHYHVATLRGFLKKRAKIARKHLTRTAERKTWVGAGGMNLYFAAFLHLTVVYPLFYSLFYAIKEREPIWLLHAPLCFLGASAYAVNWVYIKILRKKAW